MTRDELVFNERSKLQATFWNNLAGSCFTVGVLTPIVTLLVYSSTAIEPDNAFVVASILFVAICLSALLHRQAGRFLVSLTP